MLGIIAVDNSSEKARSRPTKSNRANAYAAREEKKSSKKTLIRAR
jgi:hypothetical protein